MIVLLSRMFPFFLFLSFFFLRALSRLVNIIKQTVRQTHSEIPRNALALYIKILSYLVLFLQNIFLEIRKVSSIIILCQYVSRIDGIRSERFII